MNKKGSIGIIIVFLSLLLIVGYVVVKSSNSSPNYSTGNAVSSSTSNYNPNNPAGIPEYKNTGKGDYGQLCLEDGYCDSGECQGGMCVHCGYFGETCCYQGARLSCESGSECNLGRCRATDDYTSSCGHVGYKPCYYNEYAKCYYGVYNAQLDICEACGDYEQPCCLDTQYDCDYGKCVSGICKRVENQNSANNVNTNNYNTGNYNNLDTNDYANTETTSCGYLNEPCCPQDLSALSPMGAINSNPRCYSGLECYAEVCVNGPDYESYSR